MSPGDSSVWTNLQTVAVVQRHLLALGIVLPKTSVQVCSDRKVAMQVLFEEGAERASSSRSVATELFYPCLVFELGLGYSGIYFLGSVF